MMQDGSVNTPWQRYVALGDSLTEGLEDTNADGSYRGWADRLAQHLADRNGAPVEYALYCAHADSYEYAFRVNSKVDVADALARRAG